MESNNDVIVQILPMSQLNKDYPQIDPNEGITITNDYVNSSIYYNEDTVFLIDGGYDSPEAALAHELGTC